MSDTASMPWPDATTQVFRAGSPIWSLVWRPTTPRQWHLYAEGYHEAAEQLYLSWQATQGCPDYFIFPMVFLYRHYIELRLKELIQSTASYLSLPSDWPYVHDLARLWDIVHPRLARISPEEPASDAANAGRLVKELALLDQLSSGCRYPVADTAAFEHLDVDNFFHAMRQQIGRAHV